MSDSLAPGAAPKARDVDLLQAVAAGESRAKSAVMARLMTRVRKTAGALVRQPSDADDATQLSLLEVLRSAHTFRGDASLETWADRITVRTTLRFTRREQKIRERQRQVARGELPVGASVQTSDGLARPVTAYLLELDRARRTAIVLRHVLGYSIDEIAEFTEVSRNTVKDRLVCARRDLRKLVRREALVGAPRRNVKSA